MTTPEASIGVDLLDRASRAADCDHPLRIERDKLTGEVLLRHYGMLCLSEAPAPDASSPQAAVGKMIDHIRRWHRRDEADGPRLKVGGR